LIGFLVSLWTDYQPIFRGVYLMAKHKKIERKKELDRRRRRREKKKKLLRQEQQSHMHAAKRVKATAH
jgi:hypothetical protein